MIQSVNPTNGEVIKNYKADDAAAAAHKIELADEAWQHWRKSPFAVRVQLLGALAKALRSRKDDLALLMALEMGKPLKDGIAEIEKCASVCDYYAEQGPDFLKQEQVAADATQSFIAYQPIGVVLAVMPWNFPFWQVFRFLAPALMAGNCAVLKHASNVPGCGLAIEELVKDAGFLPNVFLNILVGSDLVKELIENPIIKAVTLTGSTNAGREVAAVAGRNLKKTVLELGGSDPYIILRDADLILAAEVCAKSRLINNGQSCIAAKRFIVERPVEEEFTRLFIEQMKKQRIGDPLDPETDLGPMARADLRDELHTQVQTNIEQGAECLLGGVVPDLPGSHAFYTPTVLRGVTENMAAFKEEMFGPVAAIITADSEEHAIELANQTTFGLGAAVFTRNNEKGIRIASTELQAGSCFVNSLVKSDPRLPFGGIKDSGYGRELGIFGIREFVNIKTVSVG